MLGDYRPNLANLQTASRCCKWLVFRRCRIANSYHCARRRGAAMIERGVTTENAPEGGYSEHLVLNADIWGQAIEGNEEVETLTSR